MLTAKELKDIDSETELQKIDKEGVKSVPCLTFERKTL
jgi:hypothetical protein